MNGRGSTVSAGRSNLWGYLMPGPTYQEKRQILARHTLLGKLSETEINALLKYSRVEWYPTGEEIYAKGSPGNCMMVVLRGKAKMSSVSLEGKEIVLNIVNPGEIFGEIALLDGEERSADAIAMTDCELLILNRRDMMPFLERHADICLMLIKILCERLRRTSEQVEDLVFRHVESRIAKALLQLSENSRQPYVEDRVLELRLSQSELGNMVGITRESVNKQLKVWQRAGFLDLAKESIIIINPSALRQLI
jgi:CRP/FNR family transcriptional regulator, cyclic AMP receptor protein